jgi:hypothetical protein
MFLQGILIEGEGSVQLTDRLILVAYFVIKVNNILKTQLS